MKRTLTLFACVAACCAMMVSCKNAKTAEPTQEEIQAQKVALADSVLTQIDALAEQLSDASSNSFRFKLMELTDAEKIVKPDYLLDPSVAENLVTKSQKVNALAIYAMEMGVREIYGMPTEEANAAIVKLAAEINHPIDFDYLTSDVPVSDKIRREYEICKERGDITYFWKFQYAIVTEMSYLLIMNPDLFSNKITDEKMKAYDQRVNALHLAIEELAQYDEEMASIFECSNKLYSNLSPEEVESYNSEAAIQWRFAHKDIYISRRNALLQ